MEVKVTIKGLTKVPQSQVPVGSVYLNDGDVCGGLKLRIRGHATSPDSVKNPVPTSEHQTPYIYLEGDRVGIVDFGHNSNICTIIGRMEVENE